MSKYGCIIAQAAEEIVNNGFAVSEAGDVETVNGHNALVVVSPVLLMNLGWSQEDVNAYRKVAGDYEIDVWIRTCNLGFVHVIHSGFNVERAFERFVETVIAEEGSEND